LLCIQFEGCWERWRSAAQCARSRWSGWPMAPAGMRFVLEDKRCCICKQDCPSVYVTKVSFESVCGSPASGGG
jgi:hypothetical protein